MREPWLVEPEAAGGRRARCLRAFPAGRAHPDQVGVEVWSGRADLNGRPPAPKAGALPGCATPRPLESSTYTTLSPPRLWPARRQVCDRRCATARRECYSALVGQLARTRSRLPTFRHRCFIRSLRPPGHGTRVLKRDQQDRDARRSRSRPRNGAPARLDPSGEGHEQHLPGREVGIHSPILRCPSTDRRGLPRESLQ